MIKIGINENIFIRDAKYNAENNRLTITFEESGGTKYASVFDRLNADEAVETLPTRELILFCPMEPKAKIGEKDRTLEQRMNAITGDITSVKAILQHIMGGYMTKDEFKFDMYENIPTIDANSYPAEIIKVPIFTQVFKNMCTQFIEKMKPYLGDETKLFRLLLVRQDANNAFPTFRRKYIKENPFYESMEIPKESSKVMFTPYELKEGLDSDIPATRSDADKKGGDNKGNNSGAGPMTAANVFG
jgi:hypothetical protein